MAELTLKTAKSLYVNLGQTIKMLEVTTDNTFKAIKLIEIQKCNNEFILNCLRANMYLNFIYLDFCAAYRLYLSGTMHYEQRFALKQLYTIMNEGYKALYGFEDKDNSKKNDTRKKSIWNTYMTCYENCGVAEIEREYINFSQYLSSFTNPVIFDKEQRSLSVHYNKEDYKAIFSFLSNLDAETITIGANEFLAFMNEWQKFITLISNTFFVHKKDS